MADDSTEEAKKQAIDKMNAARQVSEAEEKEPILPSEEGGAKKTEIIVDTDDGGKIKSVHKDEADEPIDYSEMKNVRIYSPFHVYFDGPAYSISAVNGTGPFDVLPGHKNFLSLLKPCVLVVRSKRGQEEMKIDRGVLHVKDNEAIVFLDV